MKEGISVAVPPPPPSATRFFKQSTIRPRPLQKRILEYLSQGGRPSINAISTDLDVWRFSVQRPLQTMKRDGFVKDQWIRFAPTVAPKLKAHIFSITSEGRKQVKTMQSNENSIEQYPLGHRILLYISHGGLMTIGPIAKITGKPKGQVRRVMESLHNKGLVNCLISKTQTSFGWDTITHLWKITERGRQVLDADPEAYLRIVRSHKQRTGRSSNQVAKRR